MDFIWIAIWTKEDLHYTSSLTDFEFKAIYTEVCHIHLKLILPGIKLNSLSTKYFLCPLN